MDESQTLDTTASLMEMGFDSLAMTQFVLELGECMGVTLNSTLLFKYPKIDSLLTFLNSTRDGPEDSVRTLLGPQEPTKDMSKSNSSKFVGIIGMSCRFPGGINTLASF